MPPAASVSDWYLQYQPKVSAADILYPFQRSPPQNLYAPALPSIWHKTGSMQQMPPYPPRSELPSGSSDPQVVPTLSSPLEAATPDSQGLPSSFLTAVGFGFLPATGIPSFLNFLHTQEINFLGYRGARQMLMQAWHFPYYSCK